MSLERRLREHLGHAADGLPEAPDRFRDVERRGRRRRLAIRGAAALGAAALLASAPLVLRGFDETVVDFDPAEPGPPSEPIEPEEPTEPPADTLAPDALGAPVLAWGPYEHDQLLRIDQGGEERFGVPVDVAFPDGRGGVVYKPAGLSEVRWSGAGRPLAEVDGELILRGLLPGERVLYSVRDPGASGEDAVEDFFTVDLAEGAQPEHLTSTSAFERWVVGPAVAADRQLVHASCHIMCTLWLGLADGDDPEPLYHGGGHPAGPTAAIEGLAATPDGRVVGFVEFQPVVPELGPPELVLLDGAAFDELARIELPWEAGEWPGHPTVSLSADGQRVLVGLGAAGQPPAVQPPTTPYLVENALTDEPRVRPVDFAGALRWAD